MSRLVRFVPYMNYAFFFYSDPATSSVGATARARTNKWDMAQQHAFGCLYDELRYSVNKSGHIDNGKQIIA